MRRNSRNPEKLQPGLFDQDEPDVVLQFNGERGQNMRS
jgi:hypothetical protein